MTTLGIQDARRQPAILRKSRRFGQSLTRFSFLRRIAAGDRHSLKGMLAPLCARLAAKPYGLASQNPKYRSQCFRQKSQTANRFSTFRCFRSMGYYLKRAIRADPFLQEVDAK